MAISVSFPFFRAAQPGAWGPSLSGCWFSLPYLISNSSDPQLLNRGSRGPLLLGAVFSTVSFLQLSDLQTAWISCAPNYIIVQRPLNLFHEWLTEYVTSAVFGMACFNHHRVEITVMQFTGHPLPVHQFVIVPWDFNPVPYCQPSSPTPMEYATSAVFGMACLAGSEVNIQHEVHSEPEW